MKFLPPPLIPLNEPAFAEKGISLSVLRLDKIHPRVNGNKWFKLKYNLDDFQKQDKKWLVTMGGAYSNHLLAVAAAGKEFKINTACIVRGEELNKHSNNHLRAANANGMKFCFVSREEYRAIRSRGFPGERILEQLSLKEDETYFLPEGGSNMLAIKGCAEIVRFIPEDTNIICCACGTGASIAGITTALNQHQIALGISVLMGERFMEKEVLRFNGGKNNFRIEHDYSFGGYNKSSQELILFCKNFSERHLTPVEPVYTGKLFYAIMDLIGKNYFTPGSKLIAIHTGGLGIE